MDEKKNPRNVLVGLWFLSKWESHDEELMDVCTASVVGVNASKRYLELTLETTHAWIPKTCQSNCSL